MGGSWLGPDTDCGPPNPCERPPPPDPCAVKFVQCTNSSAFFYMDCDEWEAAGSPQYVAYQGGCHVFAGFVQIQAPSVTVFPVSSCNDPICIGPCPPCPPCPDCLAVSWQSFQCQVPPCTHTFEGGAVSVCGCRTEAGVGVTQGHIACPGFPTQNFPVSVTAQISCGPCLESWECLQSPGPPNICYHVVLTFAYGAGQGHAATYIRQGPMGGCGEGTYIRCVEELGEDTCTPETITVS